ncbi:xylulose kinase [Geodermatophilus obscurus DSM 43160]|uniref:Carbohydrate kinase, FGGY-like protein n=1 Tax=Geodermatophilus obscurus (strain ATCC 25078 / DSM 43160 / JCM 3152 / CCUG 61914 / KCC A-0152 / KCTC 9177 / NBRC 13315 / NRRL B-3577 / G-20) TaxID=526225 RepID=D2SFB0_GEOOG|nr:Carbohydrate kinase, FGGY-like protein [Geodermatophilus obscurus DSM 43160]
MTGVLLGADLGTSGVKVVALDPSGAVLGEGESGYEVDRPRPGWAQTDPAVWRRALDDVLVQLAPALTGRRVAGLGLSGQMHGTVLVDDTGIPLGPAVLWPDSRAVAEVDRWRALPDAARAALANPLVPGMTGPVLAWLAAHEPELLRRAAAVVLPKDVLRASLVPGADPRVTDRSDASATLLWDVVADGWSSEATAAAGVDPGLLPRVRPSAEVVGTAALPVGEVPVVVGGADTPLALLAAGTRTGRQVNLGTGAQVLRPGWTPAPADDPPVHGYADVEDRWYAMAALQNGGLAWSWVCGVLGLTPVELFDAAATVPTGAGGVVFRPFLTGERGGVAGPADRGGWTGLSASTTRAELARAAVEGVVFAVAAAADLLGGEGPVVLTGGGGRPAVVQQLLADVLAVPVRFLPIRSASAVGAALLAARGTGTEVATGQQPGRPVEPRPGPELAAALDRWHAERALREPR